jgi:hypothetical protein
VGRIHRISSVRPLGRVGPLCLLRGVHPLDAVGRLDKGDATSTSCGSVLQTRGRSSLACSLQWAVWHEIILLDTSPLRTFTTGFFLTKLDQQGANTVPGDQAKRAILLAKTTWWEMRKMPKGMR